MIKTNSDAIECTVQQGEEGNKVVNEIQVETESKIQVEQRAPGADCVTIPLEELVPTEVISNASARERACQSQLLAATAMPTTDVVAELHELKIARLDAEGALLSMSVAKKFAEEDVALLQRRLKKDRQAKKHLQDSLERMQR